MTRRKVLSSETRFGRSECVANSDPFTLRNLEIMCKQFLGSGEGKVSDELISLKRYANSLAAREPGLPNILYNPDYTALAYRGRPLAFNKLQEGLNELIDDTWSKLLALSGGFKIKVSMDPAMCEDLRSSDVGDSFIKNVKTEPRTLPLLHEMSKRSKLSLLRPDRSAGNDKAFKVEPTASQEFFHTVKPIVEAITFLVHATGSGPLRLSEVVEDRYSNGTSPRNLFISHGLVFLLRRNLKTSYIQGNRTTVIHFPPEKVVELLVYYLAVVRPVEVFLTANLGLTEQQAAYSQFIYVIKGRKMAPRELSSVIQRYTKEYFDCQLAGLDLRHVLVSIQSVFLPPIPDPTIQKFGDSQAGHGTPTATRVYGQRIDSLPGEEAALFVLSHHWCRRFHTVLGLGPENTLIRPIPYIHAPCEPTWWSPSDYVAPQQPSPNETMNQLRFLIDSSVSSAFEKLVSRCDKTVRDSVFKAAAAFSTSAGSSGLFAAFSTSAGSGGSFEGVPPSASPEDISIPPLTPDSVSHLSVAESLRLTI